jgi:SAM-dependent methyltransferase
MTNRTNGWGQRAKRFLVSRGEASLSYNDVSTAANKIPLDDETFVRLIYRVFLGRDPDRDGYLMHLERLKSGEITHEQLALDFADSDEFKTIILSRYPTYSRVENRNTDRDWEGIAKLFPYFGVLADERFRDPTPENLTEFFSSGERQVQETLQILRTKFGNFEPTSALDFGCGVGRLLIPMARAVGQAVGVDVADNMLQLARHHISQSGVNAWVTKDIPIDENFDWINSFIVFQHIPPSRGYILIERLWKILQRGGCMSLHITTYHDHTHVGELIRDAGRYSYDGERAILYVRRPRADETSMSMYDYNLSHVLAIFELKDGQEIHLQHVQHGGCYGVIIYVRKE